LSNGSTTDLQNYDNVLFQQNAPGVSLFSSLGVGGPHVFKSCVFEGCLAQYAVNVGSNMSSCKFMGSHFEANGNNVASLVCSDVNIGNNSCVVFSGCNFAAPTSITTGFYNINVPGGTSRVTVEGCRFNGAGTANYSGNMNYPTYLAGGPLFFNNYYVESGSFDYYGGCQAPTRLDDGVTSLKSGLDSGQIVKYIQTTNATPTAIYSGQYGINPSAADYVIADVVGTDSTGSSYFAQTLRSLITGNSSNTTSIVGSQNQTAIASGAQSAAFSISGSGAATVQIILTVTGVAATTIKWVASIRFIKVSF